MGLARDCRGQGTVEYILVLVVGVAIIMGGLYQLNTAFQTWANNYFGDYLSCLLETGDLPTIGGAPGDSGICDQLFKPFNLADGRQRQHVAGSEPEQKANEKPAGQREPRRAGGGGSGGGGGGGRSGRRFTAGQGRGAGAGDQKKTSKKDAGTNTGSTAATNYGAPSHNTQKPQKFERRARLDNKFAFEQESDQVQTRRILASAKKRDDGEGSKPAIKLKKSALLQKSANTSDTSFSVGNFIKYLIIACIILALIFFLGGQALSISKSME